MFDKASLPCLKELAVYLRGNYSELSLIEGDSGAHLERREERSVVINSLYSLLECCSSSLQKLSVNANDGAETKLETSNMINKNSILLPKLSALEVTGSSEGLAQVLGKCIAPNLKALALWSKEATLLQRSLKILASSSQQVEEITFNKDYISSAPGYPNPTDTTLSQKDMPPI